MLAPCTRQLCQCSALAPDRAAPRAAPGLAAGELLPPVLLPVAVQPATASSAAHAVIRAQPAQRSQHQLILPDVPHRTGRIANPVSSPAAGLPGGWRSSRARRYSSMTMSFSS